MKTKLFFKICAVSLACACLALTFSGCADDHEHVYKWTVVEEATCSSEGKREGVCGICGNVTTEVIPVDPDNHSYGEWSVALPTEDSTGTAVKTCEYDPSHVLEVTLPALSEEAYTSVTVTKAPTQIEEGIRTYVLAHEEGDIVFEIPVPARGIESVWDAVELGISNASKVRRADGTMGSGFNNYYPESFYYEFGDNYTHVVDGINYEEKFCSIDENGDFFGVSVYTYDNSISSETEEAFMNGARLGFTFVEYATKFYGTEDFLSGLYSLGKENVNGDFHEAIMTVDGVTTYTFGFGYWGGSNRLSLIEVAFTLTSDYAVKTLVARADSYYNNDQSGDLYVHSWEKDEQGNGYLVDPDADHYIDVIEITQTTLAELSSSELAAVPVNPYDSKSMLLTSIGVQFYEGGANKSSGGTPKNAEEELLTVAANSEFYLYLDVSPSTAALTLAENEITIYHVTENGATQLSYDSLSSAGILAYYSVANKSVMMKSAIAGEITLRFCTERFAKDITIYVSPLKPSALYPAVYEYHDAVNADGSNYIWNTYTNTAAVYVGQPLYFMAKPSESEASYVDGGYTAILAESGATVTAAELDGMQVYKFVASEAGTYHISMFSTADSGVNCTVTVTVTEPSQVAEALCGVYTITLDYPERNSVITLTFDPEDDYNGTVKIEVSNSTTETLSYTYDPETHTLTTQHSGGAELGYSLSFNEAYKLTLTYLSGLGGNTANVILTR